MLSAFRQNLLKLLPQGTLIATDDEPIRAELFSQERLEQHARSLAADQEVTTWPEKGASLARRVHNNRNILKSALKAIAQAETTQRAITPAAEWMLDNFHVVEEQIADIHHHLPEHYYRELPKLAGGPLHGYPRVYGISWAYVAHTDSRFSADAFAGFVSAYQRTEPLTMGELWALPITLRVVLVENLTRFAKKIVNAQRGRQLANDYATSLNSVDRNEPLSAVPLPEMSIRRAFVVQLIQLLRDHHPHTAPTSEPLTRWLAEQHLSLDELVQQEHSTQSAANLSVRNIVTSMREISSLDWRNFFESISLVESTLCANKTYASMDFASRDRYRHAIEDLARYSGRQEIDVVHELLQRVELTSSMQQNSDPLSMRRLDPGFHLIAEGRATFENELGYQPPLQRQLRRLASHYSVTLYLMSIALLTMGILVLPIWLSVVAGLSMIQTGLLALLGIFPASDVAMTIINRLITIAFKPRHLPRLRLKGGPTQEMSTFVVVPTLLTNPTVIREQIAQLEVYYLANSNGSVYFALLTDWADADAEQLPGDAELLECARGEIAQLNARYIATGIPRFSLFHRQRLWNPSESKWMGWERKRGKLAEFNRLLRGATDTSFLMPLAGESYFPRDIRYVITLDADTKLPIDTVSQLVGIAAHPLNRPCFANGTPRVTHGYGLLQPRVTPTLPQREERTVFQRLFTSAGGLDAYGSAASDVYQDLFGEGSFTGKGLYDVDAFEHAMKGRVPPNRLLSHDLFEGTFVRCALVSDVAVFEEFPSHVEVAASRQHRWTRGDWQLLPWLMSNRGRDIPRLSRWKMLDNLRRSLSAPVAVVLLVVSWALPMAPHGVWLALTIAGLSFPSMAALWDSLFRVLRTDRPRQPLRVFGGTALLAAGQVLFSLTLLAHHAWLMADAIVRTLIRQLSRAVSYWNGRQPPRPKRQRAWR